MVQQLLMSMEPRVSLELQGDSITGDAGRNILHGGAGDDMFLVEMVRT